MRSVAALGGCDRASQRGFGGVIHHRAQPPDALGGGLELGEVRHESPKKSLRLPETAPRTDPEAIEASLRDLTELVNLGVGTENGWDGEARVGGSVNRALSEVAEVQLAQAGRILS